jgi:2-methylcitrate dehydratase PrpD
MALTSGIARFVANVRYESIPPRALEAAKTAILDCLGVALAGGREESARIAGRLAREEEARQEATIFAQGFKSSAAQAAFVNGIAAHAHDFDHSFVIGGQPTSPIIPAVFCLGEALGASGRQIMEAYVAGFEVAAGLIFSIKGAGVAGWHTNGTIGAFGASAGCARLLALKESEIGTALGITASMSSGVASNFGTMTKPLHVGMAARNGVLSARLAMAGFTANPEALGAGNGFFDSFYPGRKPDLNYFEDLGQTYALEKYGVRLKPYPCGGLAHTAIYAAIELRNEHAITAAMIDRVLVAVPGETATTIAFRVPQTGLEGKFSMGYLVARALADGNVTLGMFTDEAVRDEAVLQLLAKVDMVVDPDLESGSDGSRPAIVTITLKDGRVRTRHEQFPKGSRQVPMSLDELRAKFLGCAHGVLSDVSCDLALEYMSSLETMDRIRPLAELLGGVNH